MAAGSTAAAQDGRIEGAEQGVFEVIPIGSDCWIGAGAIVMAEIGEGATDRRRFGGHASDSAHVR